VSIAIVYSLYQPIATNDNKRINALLNYYRIVYRNIGCFILLVGLILTPFLGYLIKNDTSVDNVNVIYWIFILNTVVPYFFSFKRSLLIADQKNYIVLACHYSMLLASYILQIVILILYKNYILYLLISVLFRAIENILVTKIVDKIYPFTKGLKTTKLDENEKRELSKNIKALAYHKFGSVIVNSTDNVIISKFVGLSWVGLYSNYAIIISALNTILGQIFGSITASVGNLNASASKEKTYSMFNNIFLANFWIYSFCSLTFFILSKDFITLWLGNKYVLNNFIVLVISVNFFLNGMRKTSLMFKDAMGLFWYDRYKPIAESVLNLVFSIILVQKIDFPGVILGTIISNILTCFWIEPYVVFKYGFQKNVLQYFIKYVLYVLTSIIAFIITTFSVSLINCNTLTNLLIKGIICVVVINGIYIIFFHKANEFKYFLMFIRKVNIVNSLSKMNGNK
jgi:O-antigen/teichoic acid export membrane protein